MLWATYDIVTVGGLQVAVGRTPEDGLRAIEVERSATWPSPRRSRIKSPSSPRLVGDQTHALELGDAIEG